MNEHVHRFKTSFRILGKCKQGLWTHLNRNITLSN